jgi:type I restriction enzyme S subunit
MTGVQQREIELMREYRTRLVANLVTGKLDVRRVVACLPDEADETGAIDETDVFADADDGVDADAEPEEAEA